MTEEKQKEVATKFEEKIVELQEEFGLQIYAANAVMNGGEVLPVIKYRFTKEIEHEVTAEEVKENNLEGIVEAGETVTIPVK